MQNPFRPFPLFCALRCIKCTRAFVILYYAIALIVWSPTAAGQKSRSVADASATAELKFTYKFENPRFYLRIIEIDVSSQGTGELHFVRGVSDELVDCKINLLPTTMVRIRTLFDVSRFLASGADYQSKKDFSHLGWVTLGIDQGSQRRRVRFNNTQDVLIGELEAIFRGIATQEIALFDLENAARYQPLDVPKQLETLQNDLTLQRITEPERLLPPLNAMAEDDSQSLIARNYARQIVEAIKKGKFKSPMKKIGRSAKA